MIRFSLRALTLGAALAVATAALAQVRFGLRLGGATSDVTTEEVRFSQAGRDFGLALEEARLSLHGGLFLQARIKKLVLQPEVLFSSTRTDYRLREFTQADIIESLRTESYQYVDLPVMVAYKWGPLRLQAGPVAHLFVSSRSDLEGVADYVAEFDDATWGYQAGLGLDLWNVLVDFKYQSSFDAVGDHITFGGQRVAFDRAPSQLVMTAGLSFN